jgi:hypothetical protein
VPKRTFYLVAGAAIGVGSTLWAERKIRRTAQEVAARLQPDALVVEVGRSARQVAGSAGGRVRDAVSSGRDEMKRREDELWAELAPAAPETELRTPRPGAELAPGPAPRRRRMATR